MAYDVVIDWHVTPFRRDRFLDAWEPYAAKAISFGAKQWTLTRSHDDTLHIRQTTRWDNKDDFENYWHDPDVAAGRAEIINWYLKPLLPVVHEILGTEAAGTG